MGLVHAGGKGSFHDHCLSAFFIWEEVKVHQAHRMAVYSVSTPVPGWWAGSSGQAWGPTQVAAAAAILIFAFFHL